MRSLVGFILAVFAAGVLAQETQCVEVPKNHKIVFVPWFVPTAELTWKWQPAKDPAKPDEQVVECEDGVLVISPGVCAPK